MSDTDDDDPLKDKFQMYNQYTEQVEIYPKDQGVASRLYENATLTVAQSNKLHSYRLKKGYVTQDPATGKVFNDD